MAFVAHHILCPCNELYLYIIVTLSVVMVLLVVRSGGSSAGETDSSGYTALHYAARAGHGDIVTVGPVILSC